MTWHPSSVYSGIAADEVILASAFFSNGFQVDVVIATSCPEPRNFILQIKRENNQVRQFINIPSPAGFHVTGELPAIHMSNGETLEIVTDEDIPDGHHVQATLFTRQSR